jgi:hypothetical protein
MGSILGFFHGPLSPSPRVDGSIGSGARSARMTAAARVAGANLIGQRRGHEIVGQGGVMPDLANSPSHILMKVVLPVPHCASSRSTVRPSSAHTILVSCSPNGFRLNMFFSGEKPSFEVERSDRPCRTWVKFAPDSVLEEAGFEPSVPRDRRFLEGLMSALLDSPPTERRRKREPMPRLRRGLPRDRSLESSSLPAGPLPHH